MPKEHKLDKGFEEVPLDEGFEEQPAGLDEGFHEVQAQSPDVSKTESALRGAGKGVTFGTQPILAGAGAAATQAITGNQGPKEGRNLEALYAAYKEMKEEQANKNAAAQKAHPVVFGAGEIAGAIPTSIAAGAAGKAVGMSALENTAAQGGAASLGTYLGDTQNPTLPEAALHTAVGTTGGALLHQAAPYAVKGVKALASVPGKALGLAGKAVPEGVKQGFEAGAEGINMLGKEAQQKIIPSEASRTADSLSGRLVKARESLGQEIGDTVATASKSGKTVNLNEELQGAMKQIDEHLQSGNITEDEANRLKKSIGFQLFEEAPKEAEQLGSIQQTQRFSPNKAGEMQPYDMKKTVKLKGVSPEEMNSAEDVESLVPGDSAEGEQVGQLSDIIGKEGKIQTRSTTDSSKIMSPATEGVTRGEVPVDQAYQAMKRFEKLASTLHNTEGASQDAKQMASSIQKTIKSKLSEAMPEFAQKNQTFDLYNQYLPETLMAKGENPKLAGVRYGSTTNPELKLKQATESLITNLNKPGLASKDAKQTFDKLTDSLETLQTLDNSMKAEAQVKGVPYKSVFEKLGLNKDEILSYIDKKSKRANAYDTFMGGNTVSLQVPKTMTGMAAEMAGKAGVATGNIGGQIYNASKEVLSGVASKLKGSNEVKHLGQALEDSLNSSDVVKRNAAIFAIMQNPKAKNIIDPNLKQDYDEEKSPNLEQKKNKYNDF